MVYEKDTLMLSHSMQCCLVDRTNQESGLYYHLTCQLIIMIGWEEVHGYRDDPLWEEVRTMMTPEGTTPLIVILTSLHIFVSAVFHDYYHIYKLKLMQFNSLPSPCLVLPAQIDDFLQ